MMESSLGLEMLEGPGQTVGLVHKIITTIVTAAVIVLSVTGIWMVSRVPLIPANRRLLLSVYISDLLQGLLAMSLSVMTAWRESWSVHPMLWLTQIAISTTLWVTNIYSVAFVNIDHYIAITEPAHYLQQLGPRKSNCWIIFIWILALAYCLPLYLFGAEKVVVCSSELMFCLMNYDRLATYSATAITILLPPPLFMLIATSRRALKPDRDDATRASRGRLIMYKANTITAIGSVILWGIGLAGTFSYGFEPLFRLITFWAGLCTPIWRFLCYVTIAKRVIKGCCSSKNRLL